MIRIPAVLMAVLLSGACPLVGSNPPCDTDDQCPVDLPFCVNQICQDVALVDSGTSGDQTGDDGNTGDGLNVSGDNDDVTADATEDDDSTADDDQADSDNTADDDQADDATADEDQADDNSADDDQTDDVSADEDQADDNSADDQTGDVTADEDQADDNSADNDQADDVTADEDQADDNTADADQADEVTADAQADEVTADDQADDETAVPESCLTLGDAEWHEGLTYDWSSADADADADGLQVVVELEIDDDCAGMYTSVVVNETTIVAGILDPGTHHLTVTLANAGNQLTAVTRLSEDGDVVDELSVNVNYLNGSSDTYAVIPGDGILSGNDDMDPSASDLQSELTIELAADPLSSLEGCPFESAQITEETFIAEPIVSSDWVRVDDACQITFPLPTIPQIEISVGLLFSTQTISGETFNNTVPVDVDLTGPSFDFFFDAGCDEVTGLNGGCLGYSQSDGYTAQVGVRIAVDGPPDGTALTIYDPSYEDTTATCDFDGGECEVTLPLPSAFGHLVLLTTPIADGLGNSGHGSTSLWVDADLGAPPVMHVTWDDYDGDHDFTFAPGDYVIDMEDVGHPVGPINGELVFVFQDATTWGGDSYPQYADGAQFNLSLPSGEVYNAPFAEGEVRFQLSEFDDDRPMPGELFEATLYFPPDPLGNHANHNDISFTHDANDFPYICVFFGGSINIFGAWLSPYVVIYNPADIELSLENYYLTDSQDYWDLPSGGIFSWDPQDFIQRFPIGATIGPKDMVVVTADISGYPVEHDYGPHFEMGGFDANDSDTMYWPDAIPEETIAFGSTDVLTLFFWDEVSDTVLDVDMVSLAASAEINSKGGNAVDGPDTDSTATSYVDDTISAYPSNSYQDAERHVRQTPPSNSYAGGNGIVGQHIADYDFHTVWEFDNEINGFSLNEWECNAYNELW